MNKTEQVIKERSDSGRCPICGKELTGEVREVEYRGINVRICTHHPYKEASDGREDS